MNKFTYRVKRLLASLLLFITLTTILSPLQVLAVADTTTGNFNLSDAASTEVYSLIQSLYKIKDITLSMDGEYIPDVIPITIDSSTQARVLMDTKTSDMDDYGLSILSLSQKGTVQNAYDTYTLNTIQVVSGSQLLSECNDIKNGVSTFDDITDYIFERNGSGYKHVDECNVSSKDIRVAKLPDYYDHVDSSTVPSQLTDYQYAVYPDQNTNTWCLFIPGLSDKPMLALGDVPYDIILLNVVNYQDVPSTDLYTDSRYISYTDDTSLYLPELAGTTTSTSSAHAAISANATDSPWVEKEIVSYVIPGALLDYFSVYTGGMYKTDVSGKEIFAIDQPGGQPYDQYNVDRYRDYEEQEITWEHGFMWEESFLPMITFKYQGTDADGESREMTDYVFNPVGEQREIMIKSAGWSPDDHRTFTASGDAGISIEYSYDSLRGGLNALNSSSDAWLNMLSRIHELTTKLDSAVTDYSGSAFNTQLRDALGGQYLISNGTTVLNGYTLEYYFTIGTLNMIDPLYMSDVVSEASNNIQAKRDMITVFADMNKGDGPGWVLPNKLPTSPLIDLDNFPYNASRMGALGLNWRSGYRDGTYGDCDSTSVSSDSLNLNAKKLITACISTYWETFVVEGLWAYAPSGSRGQDYNAPDFIARVSLAHDINAAFGDMYPWIREMYEWKSSSFPESLKELYDRIGDPNVKGNDKLVDLTQFSQGNVNANLGDGTPMDRFYSFNYPDVAIISIDRDRILNDIEADETNDIVLQTMISDTKDGVYDSTTYDTPEAFMNSVQSNTSQYLTTLTQDMGIASNNPTAADDLFNGGESIYSTDVYMSNYILEGMKYSSTYIPMRTNVYDTQLISTYDDDFRSEFFDKYGYLRKALLIDTNGSAAVNYYNTSGNSQGTLRLCTLRDLVYNDDGNDVVLYIDNGLYNSDEIITKASTILTQHESIYNQLYDDLGTINEIYTALHQTKIEDSFLGPILSVILKGANLLHIDFDISSTDEYDLTDMNETQFWADALQSVQDRYNFTITSTEKYKSNIKEINSLAVDLENASLASDLRAIDDVLLKTGKYSQYDTDTMTALTGAPNSAYVDLEDTSDITLDNYDSVVLPSSLIKTYMESKASYIEVKQDGETLTTTEYTTSTKYSPMMAFAFISYLYRDPKHFTLANLTATNDPVFIASDDLVSASVATGSTTSNQWYRNSLLNFALMQNLKANVQIDYAFCLDLDCPLYMDIFGNILTESGIVVIPAASNATLHTANYKNYNVSFGLYSVYGKEYKIPVDTSKAYSVLFPFFTPDLDRGVYEIANVTVNAGSNTVNFANLSNYASDTSKAVQTIYQHAVVNQNGHSRLNYPAMVNIIHEVLRGAYMENINKDKEGLTYTGNGTKGALVAAAKYESLLESLESSSLNSLLAIPDFTKLDGVDYWVSFALKMLVIATVIVAIMNIYRDAVANSLGWRTFKSVISAAFLAVMCITVIPNLFNLTYYVANKALLEDDAFRIMLINEEKRKCGVEIKMTSVDKPETDNRDFSVLLEPVTVPWWEQMQYVIYGSSAQNISDVREEAFGDKPIIHNNDIFVQGDGIYSSSTQLFDSVGVDYLWQGNSYGQHGLYLWNTNSDQTASYYLPYYAFLKILVSNVNAYNSTAANGQPAYSYTSKYVSGNRLKTCGLCYNYFSSQQFMGEDALGTDDIMQIRSIYYNADQFINYKEGERFDSMTEEDEGAFRKYLDASYRQALAAAQNKQLVEASFRYSNVFSADELMSFGYCKWYNVRALPDLENRIKALDSYAREFVADNHDLLTKVTDETFLKCMALYMSIKYNQLFGIDSANSLELYNLDSTDILRLSTESPEAVALSVTMSYPRFVYNYGGEASVYAASFLSMILWVGSFLKPILTLLAFVSVVVSVWVFRILLNRPSANIYGYFITVVLLCATNLMHAIFLKVGLLLPGLGIPMVGCLIFMCVFQIVYLLCLSYVVGIALKDWSNLGYNEYQKEAMRLRAKFNKNSLDVDHLNGNVKHHEDNWDYYNDLVSQHRSRNTQ